MRISDWSSDVCSSDLWRVSIDLLLPKLASKMLLCSRPQKQIKRRSMIQPKASPLMESYFQSREWTIPLLTLHHTVKRTTTTPTSTPPRQSPLSRPASQACQSWSRPSLQIARASVGDGVGQSV